jgi:hypothetical protein
MTIIGEMAMAMVRTGEQSCLENPGVEGSGDMRTMDRQAGAVVVAEGEAFMITGDG